MDDYDEYEEETIEMGGFQVIRSYERQGDCVQCGSEPVQSASRTCNERWKTSPRASKRRGGMGDMLHEAE